MCPRRWKGVHLAYYMLGMSDYNTENLTENHSGAPCWEICHVSGTLRNPTVVFNRSRNLWVPPQEAKFPDPTHPSRFLVWQPKFVDPIILVSHPFFSFYHPLHVHHAGTSHPSFYSNSTQSTESSILAQ